MNFYRLQPMFFSSAILWKNQLQTSNRPASRPPPSSIALSFGGPVVAIRNDGKRNTRTSEQRLGGFHRPRSAATVSGLVHAPAGLIFPVSASSLPPMRGEREQSSH
jgi:hypothetical protein